MKATIDKFGTLIVTPENGTEAYALGKWLDQSLLGSEWSGKIGGKVACYQAWMLKILTEEQE